MVAAAWACPQVAGSRGGFLRRRAPRIHCAINFELHTLNPGGLRFTPVGWPQTSEDATDILHAGWNHIVATYSGTPSPDGAVARIYHDGTLVSERTGIAGGNTLSQVTDAWTLGIGYERLPFHGALDDVVL